MSPLSSELEYRPPEPKTQVSHAMGSACCVFEGSREKTGQFNALGHVLRDEHLLRNHGLIKVAPAIHIYRIMLTVDQPRESIGISGCVLEIRVDTVVVVKSNCSPSKRIL